MKKIFIAALALTVGLVGTAAVTLKANDADNSANNATDRQSTAVTPQSQSNAAADVKVTRNIRRAIVKDSSLSVYAHNIKIITTKEHQVYLRGTVSSSDDVGKIADLAKKYAGDYPVNNELSVSNK